MLKRALDLEDTRSLAQEVFIASFRKLVLRGPRPPSFHHVSNDFAVRREFGAGGRAACSGGDARECSGEPIS